MDTYEPDQENVKLLTLHAAKGLEFPVVILSGCEANLLPLTVFRECDPEEERRLFYVGLTRATQNIFSDLGEKKTPVRANTVPIALSFFGDIEEI